MVYRFSGQSIFAIEACCSWLDLGRTRSGRVGELCSAGRQPGEICTLSDWAAYWFLLPGLVCLRCTVVYRTGSSEHEAGRHVLHFNRYVRRCGSWNTLPQPFSSYRLRVSHYPCHYRILPAARLLLPVGGHFWRTCHVCYWPYSALALEVAMAELNEIIHQPARLRIMSVLVSLDGDLQP